MKNKYTKEFEDSIREKAKTNNILELINYAKLYFGYEMSKHAMENFLYRRNIKHKEYNRKKAHVNKKPIGAEWVRKDGMVLIKVAEPSVWKYKQRHIYEERYGKIPKGYKVIFLDQDRTNFDIDNLMAVPGQDSLIAFNKKILSKNKEVTKLGLQVAHLINKIKEDL